MQSSSLTKARYAAKTLKELEAVALRFGLSKGWALHVFNGRLAANKRKGK